MACVICRVTMGCVMVTTALLCSARAGEDGGPGETMNLRLSLRDSESGELVPGRITLEQRPVGAKPVYHFVESLDAEGTAVPYDVARSETSFEKHTTVSAHPFGAQVPPGHYVVYYEHGPEWRGNKAQVTVEADKVCELELPTSRWIDMNARGWYAGDTHVHRSLEELPNVMRAEDLNVALPLSYWVRDAYTPPSQGDLTAPALRKGALQKGSDPARVAQQSEAGAGKGQTPFEGLITVDPNRVIWPMNTEYELFTINGRRHTQGAVFVLNHQTPLTLPAPPVAPIAAEARRQGALLDLDKHSWPWSLMLVPIMDVDLFELSNNHIWKTAFYFKQWTQEMRPDGWNIETDAGGFTEWGWIDFGFKTYYALLNCGFKMRPSVGTGSGVHPVPLGYGRVYVECPDGFSYDNWMRGLDAGRSFVTTGPMLFTTVDGQPPGSTITVDEPTTVRVQGGVETIHSVSRIEIVKNGRVIDVIMPQNEYESPWIHRSKFDVEVPIDGTSWIAVRCFEAKQSEPPWKMGFAHSSPVHIEMPGKPLRPRKVETAYFIDRMQEELARNKDVLAADELAEYQRALDVYREIDRTAVDGAPVKEEQLLALAIPPADLPEGWTIPDLDDTPYEAFGSSPAIVSHPILLDEVIETVIRDAVQDINVSRVMIAVYSAGRTDEGDRGCLHYAFVCADETSAAAVAETLKKRHDFPTHSRVWRRGNVTVWIRSSQRSDAAEVATFARLIESRLPQG